MKSLTDSFRRASDRLEETFFLTELLGAHVSLREKKIGKLIDLVIVENARLPEVSHILVRRPFGHPSLLVPWRR